MEENKIIQKLYQYREEYFKNNFKNKDIQVVLINPADFKDLLLDDSSKLYYKEDDSGKWYMNFYLIVSTDIKENVLSFITVDKKININS